MIIDKALFIATLEILQKRLAEMSPEERERIVIIDSEHVPETYVIKVPPEMEKISVQDCFANVGPRTKGRRGQKKDRWR